MAETLERYFQIQDSNSFYDCAEAIRTNPNYNQPQEWHVFRFPDHIQIEFEPLEVGWKVWLMNGANSWLHIFELAPGLEPNRETAIALHEEYIVAPVKAKLAAQTARRAEIDARREYKLGDSVKGTYTVNPDFVCTFTGKITYVQVHETGVCYDITLTTTTGTFHVQGDVLRYTTGDDSFKVSRDR